MDIPVNKYLDYALTLKPEEERLRSVFSDWLPDRIVDCHAHCNTPEHLRWMGPKTYRHMLSTFPYYRLEDSQRIHRLLHPGKTIRTLRFPKTFMGIDHRAANSYLLDESPEEDRVAIFGLPEDIGYTMNMLCHPRCSALKMYYSYVEPNAETIYECFPKEVLESAQDLDIPIVLHVPKMIVRSVGDVLQVLNDFPRLRVSLAHLGLSKMLVPGLGEAYEMLVPYERVVLDTALNPSQDVVHMALTCFGADRVMYGSDEPLHLIRSVAYEHPEHGQRLATEYPYHWVDPVEHAQYKHLAKDVVHAHWQALGALKGAIERFPRHVQDSIKERVFRENAEAFFSF